MKQVPGSEYKVRFRVRYSETDQMGTFYNSRVLEWFECGRTEWLRAAGVAYSEIEAKGVCLPVIEAHVHYLGRARYDDELEMSISARMFGRASVKFDMQISHAGSATEVARGYTVHAVTGREGRPARPPRWLCGLFIRDSER